MKINELKTIYLQIRNQPENRVYTLESETILIITTMRSRSSLLAHLLGSHPEITGKTEQHLTYNSVHDLVNLRHQVFKDNPADLSSRFVLDKLVHNGSVIAPNLLNRDDIYAVFLLRDPVETVASLASMRERYSWDVTVPQAIEYYISRINGILKLAGKLRRPAIFITAEQLVNDTPLCFKLLEDKLGLNTPLSENYSITETSQQAGRGDPSALLQTGSIVSERNDYDPPVISDQQKSEIIFHYQLLVSRLMQACHHVSS